MPAPGHPDAVAPNPGHSARTVLLLCQLPTALLLVAAIVESMFYIGHFDDGALYIATGVMAALMLATGGYGWWLERRALRKDPDHEPTLGQTWWRLQALLLIPSQIVCILAGLLAATFTLTTARCDPEDGAEVYFGLSLAYFVMIVLPLLASAWLLTRRRIGATQP